MRAFRSFDILITCHGSHLGNMLFAPHAVFVELQASYTHTKHSYPTCIDSEATHHAADTYRLSSDVFGDMPLHPL